MIVDIDREDVHYFVAAVTDAERALAPGDPRRSTLASLVRLLDPPKRPEPEALPVLTEANEVMCLRVEHRGRIVMTTSVPVRGERVGVVAVQAQVTYRADDSRHPWVARAQLRSTAEDVAAWVAGDGTDPQRLALADGIREGWHHRPHAEELRSEAEAIGTEAMASLDRFHGLVADAGVVRPDAERWAAAVKEAAEEIQSRFAEAGDLRRGVLEPDPLPFRRTPPGSVPVRAEDVAGGAARIAELEHDLARAHQRLIEEMARSAEMQRQLERAAPPGATAALGLSTIVQVFDVEGDVRIRAAAEGWRPDLEEAAQVRAGLLWLLTLLRGG